MKKKRTPNTRLQDSMPSTTATVAKLADFLYGEADLAKRNAWKKRMLTAGLGKIGIDFPPDWDSLPEEEKERRLNLAIDVGIKKE